MASRRFWLLASLAILGCGDDTGVGATSGPGGGGAGGAGASGGGGEAGSGGALACGDSGGALPDGLTVLSAHDGVPFSSLRDETFEITVDGKSFVLNDEPVFEAVRFDLATPARIHGFTVHLSALPADPAAEIAVGLYADFGHNGFDFWAPEPLFSGTRCAGDVDEAGFVTFVFDAPVVLDKPGLVYVAHRAEPGSAAFTFDESVAGAGDCALFDSCHSALNLPDALNSSYYNGVSFPFQYDYLVDLHVEPFGEVAPEDTVFASTGITAGAHVSFGDYDDDGDDDFLTDGPALWENQGDGTFVNVTTSVFSAPPWGSGGVFGDFDNDGCLDLFVFAESYAAPDTLYRNDCMGGFTDVTAASGIVDQQTYETCNDAVNNTRSPTAAAAWADVDADGLLDLYLANFICWEKGTTYVDEVWHNLGNGTFESWTSTRGFTSLARAGRGVNPIDIEGDGDIDLFVNNYRLQANLFFLNAGDGTFEEAAMDLGVAGSLSQGYYGHTIGTAFGDLDNDGDFDLVSANLAHPRFFDFSDKTEILLQGPGGTFSDIQGDWSTPAGAAGLRYQETHSVPALADFDHDGALDLVMTAIYDGRPMDFYWGAGNGSFEEASYQSGLTTKNGWGIALSDVDLDGDVDVLAGSLFLNRGASTGNFVKVRVVGNVDANRAGIGSTVIVSAGGVSRISSVQGGTGQGNQNSATLSFGLGGEDTIDEILVRFPGGKEVVFAGPIAANQSLRLMEDGALVVLP